MLKAPENKAVSQVGTHEWAVAELARLQAETEAADAAYSRAVQRYDEIAFRDTEETRRLRSMNRGLQMAEIHAQAEVDRAREAAAKPRRALNRHLQEHGVLMANQGPEGPSVRHQRQAEEFRLNRLRDDLLRLGVKVAS